MPILNLKITNPQALEIIAKIKSGEIKNTVINWFKKNRWYFFSVLILAVLITAAIVGKKLSEGNSLPSVTLPDIDSPQESRESVVKSNYGGLKEEIQQTNTDLPDPFIPTFDNSINLLETPL